MSPPSPAVPVAGSGGGPEAVVAATVGILVAVAVIAPAAYGAFALVGVTVLVWLAAAIRRRPATDSGGRAVELGVRLAVLGPILVLAAAAVVLSEPTGPADVTSVLGLATVSRTGLHAGATLACRAVIGVVAATALTLTVSPTGIAVGLHRLRVPSLLVAVGLIMIRYLDLFGREWQRTRLAMMARGYEPTGMWQAGPLAAGAGSLFVRSYQRSENVHRAMVARGFTGTVPSSTAPRAGTNRWLGAVLAMATAAAIAAASRLDGPALLAPVHVP